VAKIIKTHDYKPKDLDEFENECVYNGKDCFGTLDALDAMLPQLDNHTAATYSFSKSLQGPVLEMGFRGVLVDQQRRQEVIEDFLEQIELYSRQLERIVLEGVGMVGFKWSSNNDLKTLFYHYLKIPIVSKGGRPTVDRNALERFNNYLIARPIVSHLLLLRDLSKKVSVLRSAVDPDGRYRTTYNIGGTNTGRFSSSFNEFGTGGNGQNVEESLRSMFVADPGMKFAKFDAKSGESFVVGAIEWNLFNDPKYLEACESGDPHTAVARICWPTLGWTGDLKRDKDLAERPYYRHYTYRFMCKKLGHGSNYGGKPETLASQSKLPLGIVREFQPNYFTAFPAHLKWQEYVDVTLRKTGTLISLMGRKRQFWGRRTDDDTLREAIAYDPQSSLADIVNRAMLRLWHMRLAIIVFQDHDALTFMYPEQLEREIIPTISNALPERIDLNGDRSLVIPYDCKTGWNRGEMTSSNPDGLIEWTGHDSRKRSPFVHLLDRKSA
jgi:DNA polymerase I-like protein with 3'-5' exonuclease and polymerase domains